jgi:hypothetical protein
MDPANVNSYTGTPPTPFSGGWNDLSKSMNSGYLVGGSSYNSASKSFDTNVTLATQSNYISCNTLTFTDASEYTLDVWVKLRTGIGSTTNTLFGADTSYPFVLISCNTGNSWYPRFCSSSNIYYNFSSISGYNLEQNWANITLIFKSNRNIDYYLNGVYRETLIATNTSLVISKIASGYLSGGTYYSLQGSISATKIYNRVLSSTEVERNYLSLKSRFGL